MLVAAFDLSYFGGLFFDTRLPERSVFTLTDANGIRLTRFPETEKYTWVADLPQMIARMSGREEEGTFLKPGWTESVGCIASNGSTFRALPFPI